MGFQSCLAKAFGEEESATFESPKVVRVLWKLDLLVAAVPLDRSSSFPRGDVLTVRSDIKGHTCVPWLSSVIIKNTYEKCKTSKQLKHIGKPSKLLSSLLERSYQFFFCQSPRKTSQDLTPVKRQLKNCNRLCYHSVTWDETFFHCVIWESRIEKKEERWRVLHMAQWTSSLAPPQHQIARTWRSEAGLHDHGLICTLGAKAKHGMAYPATDQGWHAALHAMVIWLPCVALLGSWSWSNDLTLNITCS